MEEEKREITEAKTFMPDTFNNRFTMAKILAGSGLMPNGMNTAEKVCVALQYGYELGLSPMVSINNIAVVNGKPTLSADYIAGCAVIVALMTFISFFRICILGA